MKAMKSLLKMKGSLALHQPKDSDHIKIHISDGLNAAINPLQARIFREQKDREELLRQEKKKKTSEPRPQVEAT